MQGLDKFDRFLLHVDHQGIDAIAVIAVADQSGNCDGQACRGRDQRLCNTTGKDGRITDAMRRYCREYLDHADNSAE